MNQIQYSSSSEDEQPVKKLKSEKFEPKPEASTLDLPVYYPSQDTKEIAINVPYKDLSRPIQGPMNPFMVKEQTVKNVMNGFVENHHIDHTTFKNLSRTFETKGFTLDPNAQNDREFVGVQQSDRTLVMDLKKQKFERESKGDVAGDFKGPWAGFKKDEIEMPPLAPGQLDYQPVRVFDSSKLEVKDTKESSVFHGKEELDYLGRSYLYPGVDFKGDEQVQESFIPKTLVHTWTGHTKGVNVIRYFPKSAHLLLSCSMDQKIKIWDVHNDRACKRTFMGHSKGVRDVVFNHDGTQFLSASYDKFIKLWDTETGQVISRYTTGKIPFCVQYNPNPERQSTFLTGCQDNNVYQFDIRSGKIVNEYVQHSGPVNTITFVDDNRRFI